MHLNDRVKIKHPSSPGEAFAVFVVVESIRRGNRVEVSCVYEADVQGKNGKLHRFIEGDLEPTVSPMPFAAERRSNPQPKHL